MAAEATLHGRLPHEVWDHVVDCLQDDRDTLVACSLTCHTLLSASRRHAFYAVSLYSADDSYSFEAILSERNYAGQYVRVLTVHGDGQKDHEHTTFPSNGEWLQLLPKLDYLASLRLRQLSFFIPNELKSNMHTLVPRLQTLDLKTMDFRADDLASLIRASSALSTLILRSASAISGSLSSSVAPTNDMLVNTVNTLVWDPSAATGQTSPLIPVTQWLEGAQRRLRRLAITRIDSEPTPLMLVQKLLSDSGDSLEDLFLEFTDTTDANGLAPLLNLGGNTRLRTLHIAVHSDTLPYITRMLVAPSTRDAFGDLTSLVIRIVARSDTVVDMPPKWEHFCDELPHLCATHPHINFTLCFDLRISAFFSAALFVPVIEEHFHEEVSFMTVKFAIVVSELASKLPPLHRTGGRARFGLAWLWTTLDSFFSPVSGEQFLPLETFLGDPEWYHNIQDVEIY